MCKNAKIGGRNFNFFGHRFRSYGRKKRDFGTFAKKFPRVPLTDFVSKIKISKTPRRDEQNRVFEKSVTKIGIFLKILTPLFFEVKIGPIEFSLLILICLENMLGWVGVILFYVQEFLCLPIV